MRWKIIFRLFAQQLFRRVPIIMIIVSCRSTGCRVDLLVRAAVPFFYGLVAWGASEIAVSFWRWPE